CTINVSFAPKAIGTRAGAIIITDNAGGSPHVINLIGTGTPSGPALSLSSTSLDFGSQPVGTTSVAKVVTLTNNGTSTLAITSIGNGGDYAPPTNTCSGAPPGGACSVSPSAFTLNTTTKITITVTTTARSNAVPVSGPQGVPPHVALRLDLPWLLWLLAVTSLGSLAMFGRKRASLAF